MGYYPNGTVFKYEDSHELLIAGGFDPSDRYATIEPLRGEIENEVECMGVRKLDSGLTNSAAFYRAMKKAQAGDPTWEEDFQLVGSSLLNDLREAMKQRCKLGAIEEANRRMRQAVFDKEQARTRAHNEAIEARRKAQHTQRLQAVQEVQA